MRVETLRRLAEAVRRREAAILVTDLSDGAERLVFGSDSFAGDPLAGELRLRFASGRSGPFEQAGGGVMLTVRLPAPRLVIVGAVHIAQALVPMAAIAGFDVTVVDPRTAFAAPARFEGARLVADWPDGLFARAPLDAFTAVAVMSHEPRIDDQPLAAALAAGCFYVGALGSRKTHAARLERLAAAGVAPDALARIRGPVGLAIGARSPAEIAVSILAELIASLRLGEPKS